MCLLGTNTENKNFHTIDIFDYENIAMVYDFQTGSSALYLQKSENEYELLYKSIIKNGIESSIFHSKNNSYILIDYNHNTKNIASLYYMKKIDFIKYVNKFVINQPTGKFEKSLLPYKTTLFMCSHSNKLISNNTYLNDNVNSSVLKDYKKTFIKYEATTKLIPVYCILDSIIENIHKYISTKKFDNSTFEKNLLELKNFKEICPSSISVLDSFIKKPSQADMHKVCSTLEKNYNNIEQLINMYLEDELNLEEKGEEHDSK